MQEKNYHSYLRTFRGDFSEVQNETVQSDSPTPAPTNVTEAEDSYLIQVALPGYKKEEISVKVADDILSIRAEVQSVRSETGHKFHKQEFFTSSFEKTILLPEDVNDNNIKASFVNGLLNIDLPKSQTPVKASFEISIR